MNPEQVAFVELIVAAMKDVADSGALSQFHVRFDPTFSGKNPTCEARIIIVPEKMKRTWPKHAPAGTPFS